jgi:multidrug efflux pump subunit AcrB
MTLAMGWGLFVGTFLSLLWIPVGYRIIDFPKIKKRV